MPLVRRSFCRLVDSLLSFNLRLFLLAGLCFCLALRLRPPYPSLQALRRPPALSADPRCHSTHSPLPPPSRPFQLLPHVPSSTGRPPKRTTMIPATHLVLASLATLAVAHRPELRKRQAATTANPSSASAYVLPDAQTLRSRVTGTAYSAAPTNTAPPNTSQAIQDAFKKSSPLYPVAIGVVVLIGAGFFSLPRSRGLD